MNEISESLVRKAERSIAAAETLANSQPEFAASRAYYAMFYLAEALLAARGLHFNKHSAVHSAFGEHFAKPGLLDVKYHRWLLDAFDARLEADYEVEIDIQSDTRAAWLNRQKSFSPQRGISSPHTNDQAIRRR
jgi:uncharacterized protein (UPF0332 family)